MDIQNKIVVVTGAASGLGAATAALLASQHATVIFLDKNITSAEKNAETSGGVAFACDVSSEISVRDVIEKIMAKFKAIHVVVNCAGIVHAARLIGKKGVMPLDDFSRVIQINLIGTFNVMRLVAEKMCAQDTVSADGERGVIINTASIAAFEGQLGQAAYSASKGGVVAMTLPIARELSRFGVRVMTIAPGIMETPMLAELPEAAQKALAEDVPFPKKLGHPKQFAELVLHIIENNYLNGSTIRLDGALRLK